MLLVLIAVPVVLLVTVARGLLRDYAPSNMLIHAVRASRPSVAQAVGLAGLAAGLLTTAHLVTSALANGAPDWLNIVVLVLLWDAIKLAVLSVIVCARGVWSGVWSRTRRATNACSWNFVSPACSASPRTTDAKEC